MTMERGGQKRFGNLAMFVHLEIAQMMRFVREFYTLFVAHSSSITGTERMQKCTTNRVQRASPGHALQFLMV